MAANINDVSKKRAFPSFYQLDDLRFFVSNNYQNMGKGISIYAIAVPIMINVFLRMELLFTCKFWSNDTDSSHYHFQQQIVKLQACHANQHNTGPAIVLHAHVYF